MKWLSYMLVSLIWGCTDPFLKRGSQGMDTVITTNSKLLNIFTQFKWLLFNYQFTIPFVLNQVGSVLYYVVVAQSDISLAVPVINSLTLIVTTIVGMAIGEEVLSFKRYCGIFCIVIGVSFSLLSKSTYT